MQTAGREGRPLRKRNDVAELVAVAVGVAGVVAIIGLIKLDCLLRTLRGRGGGGDERQRNAGEHEGENGFGEHRCLRSGRWRQGDSRRPWAGPCRTLAKTNVKWLTRCAISVGWA